MTVDLSAKTVAAGSQPIRGCILAPKNAAGTIVNNTEIRKVYSVEDVETSHGQGSLGALAYKALKKRHPNCQIDVVSPTPSAGGIATGSVQVSGTITADYTGRYDIHGHIIDVPWLVGETAAQFHAKSVTYIGRYTRDLFCVASVGTGPDRVRFDAKTAGPVGNDIKIGFELIDGAGGTVATADTALSGGSTEPDFSSAYGTIQGRQYDFILVCLSNADAVSTTGNLARLETHIDGLDSGPAAKLQQGIAGHTGLRTSAMVSSAARNSQVIELINAQNARSLPCEVGGDEMGDRMELVTTKISANRIGRKSEIIGSEDTVADNPTTVQSDAALLAGLSLIGYRENGDPFLIRAVTTYCATDQGAQLLPTDCNEIDAVYQYAKDISAFLPVEFAEVKIARDATDETSDPLPEGVVEERDVRAAINARTESFWIPKGVINGTRWREQVLAGNLIVRVNDTDETQVDMFIPAKPFKNLAKFGAYISKDG